MATTLLATAVKSVGPSDSLAARAVDRLPTTFTNVSSVERWLSLAAGGGLLACGFTGRGPTPLSMLAGGYLLYRAATGHCPAYQAMQFSTADSTAPNTAVAAGHGTRVDASVVVKATAKDAYEFWRDFENLPRVMTHLIDVDTTTDGRSRWAARGPLGTRVVWDAELVTDTPGEVIAWKSLAGSDVDTAGSVRFRPIPGKKETEVRVSLKYDPPLGKVGTAVAKLFGEEPGQQVRADLERFKQVIEASDRAREKKE
jgi:uncharacterized membrane protein